MPLQIDALYSEYQSAAAFALASVLAGLGVLTLIGKTILVRLIKSTQGVER